jgi:hypothetical protein
MRLVCGVILLILCGCKFFVPAYDNPDSKRYEEQKEKGKTETNSLSGDATEKSGKH